MALTERERERADASPRRTRAADLLVDFVQGVEMRSGGQLLPVGECGALAELAHGGLLEDAVAHQRQLPRDLFGVDRQHQHRVPRHRMNIRTF